MRPEEVLKHALRLAGNIGADAVAAADADEYWLERRVIDPRLVRLHALHARQLRLEQAPEVLFGTFDCVIAQTVSPPKFRGHAQT